MKNAVIWFRTGLARIGIRTGKRVSPNELFSRFRAVLDSNNRSLEIITDIGDTLSGDYLFDIQYVRRSYTDLSAALERSLASFDKLTESRYRGLEAVYRTIDGNIRHAMDGAVQPKSDLVLFVEDIDDNAARAVGGKARNVAELVKRIGVPVPDAFVMTTQACDAYLRHNGIRERAGLTGADTAAVNYQEAQELILHGKMPPELDRAIESGLRKLKKRCRSDCYLAVRSSAGEEDGDFSFAGQYETVLNVPAETAAVGKAYRKVLASLYAPGPVAYQQRLGYRATDMHMAVVCMVMVDAAVSGVAFSRDPQGATDGVLINAAWGLGTSVVEGVADPDQFRVSRDDPPVELERRIGAKDTITVRMTGGGTVTLPVPMTARARASLSPEQVTAIAGLALKIEQNFRRPQDIEWAIDGAGNLFILQSRPLRLSGLAQSGPGQASSEIGKEPLARKNGLSVHQGAAAGRVFILRNLGELDRVPPGAILVARHDSSQFVRVMADVAAIITDRGALTSHMASLSREFRLPTAVNTGDMTRTLVHGQQVTVQIDEQTVTVYPGVVPQILGEAGGRAVRLEELAEYRKKRHLLRYIVPLNLVDPLRDDFTPKACRTLHDILRFIHEKSVAELIDQAGEGWRSNRAVKLDLSVPAGIVLIDIGDGLQNAGSRDHVTADQVTSIPLRAVIRGMVHPGVWRSEAVPLRAGDFMTSMLRASDIVTGGAPQASASAAVISREYVNLSLKFGYHFIILDAFCSEVTRNNHLYFRFAGGATDITKRSRRLQLIAAVLQEQGFTIKLKGDMIIARLANIGRDEMEARLDVLGRLISFTRQLDALLHDDGAVERYKTYFVSGRYEFPSMHGSYLSTKDP
jgi:pyruvate, water dikinase